MTFNITSYVNSALSSGQFVGARLEATVSPVNLTGYYGGNFGTPSLTYSTSGQSVVPEPGTYALTLAGLVAVGVTARNRKRRVS